MRTREEIKKERDVYNKRGTDMFTIIYLKLLELELNQVENKVSFLTSQEVCEWIRIGKEKYHTGCSKGTDITLMQIDLNMIYCPQCGKKIKEVSM